MDITPIYELRDRLRTAMIAGTNLLAEDFRLKRAVEALAPLEKAAPVFAKVGELSRNLLDPGQTDKEGALLDTITLVDAVCCTQGQVGMQGELEPVITESSNGTILSNAPYSVLSPLQEALTTSGSGHYSYVTDCHNSHPELFKDYRVRSAMVQALGAAYAELADDVSRWLIEDGEDIVPLLMRGFNPKGKKEMVRRLFTIESICGAKANDFYIKHLDEAEGEVRQNLIYALRHSEENEELLVTLSKQERGNSKKAACYALAFLGDGHVDEFFATMYKKKPTEVMQYLFLNKSPWASKLVADCIHTYFFNDPPVTGKKKDDIEAVRKQTELQAASINALIGKTGDDIYEAIRFIAENTDKPLGTLGDKFVWTLCASLIMNPEAALVDLAYSLYDDGKTKHIRYFQPAFLAKLITANQSGSDEDWYGWLEETLRPATPGGKPDTILLNKLEDALSYLRFDETNGKYHLQVSVTNPFFDSSYLAPPYSQPVECGIGERFFDILIHCARINIDRHIERLINPADQAQREKLEEYFYQVALTTFNNSEYLRALRKCGSTRCEDLLVHYAKNSSRLSMWDLIYYINCMPGTNAAKYEEASRIPALIEKEGIKVLNWNKEAYLQRLEEFKN